jgi:hypothetical protein
MTQRWLFLVGSEDFIPPQKVKTKITVMLVFAHGVMDSMYVGRD